MMSGYYRANRTTFPADIHAHRNAVVEVIMAGTSAAQAFTAVRQKA